MNNEIKLGLIACVSAILGSAIGAFANSLFIDAGTKRETNVQMIELAIGILNREVTDEIRPLRSWAVELLDEVSPVKLDDEAKDILIYRDELLDNYKSSLEMRRSMVQVLQSEVELLKRMLDFDELSPIVKKTLD